MNAVEALRKTGVMLVAAVAALTTPLVHAAWPERPVRLIVPWAPGGSTDIVARILAADLTKRLGQQFIVENRAGGGAIVGMQFTAQLPPDGANFLLTSTGYGFLINTAKVDLVDSFAPVAMIERSALSIAWMWHAPQASRAMR